MPLGSVPRIIERRRTAELLGDELAGALVACFRGYQVNRGGREVPSELIGIKRRIPGNRGQDVRELRKMLVLVVRMANERDVGEATVGVMISDL